MMPLIESEETEILSEVDANGREIILSSQALTIYVKKSNPEEQSKVLNRYNLIDILGANVKEGDEMNLEVHTFAIKKKSWCSSCCAGEFPNRQLCVICIVFKSTTLTNNWVNALKCASRDIALQYDGDLGVYNAPHPRNFLVFVNPVSGTRKSVKLWTDKVKPMLEGAGVEFKVMISTKSNDALEFVRNCLYLTSVQAILCIGGDGTLFEVVQGILCRKDRQACFQSISLVPIPGGTGNGLAKSITFASEEACTAEACTYIALKGKPNNFDLADVQTLDQTEICHSFLLTGWGLIANVDILSETMRYLGEMRLYLAAVYYIIKKNTYPGRLTIIPPSKAKSPRAGNLEGYSDKNILPPFSEPFVIPGYADPEVLYEGPMTLVWILQTTHCTENMFSAPGCQLGSGEFTIFWAETTSRIDLISLLLSIDSGGHSKNPKVKSRQAVAYRIEPLEPKYLLMTVDGEAKNGPIQAVLKGNAAKTFLLHK